MQTASGQRGSWWAWGAFAVSALAGIALFFIPGFVIRPFAYQSPRALVVAMALRQRAPIGTLCAALLCLLLVLLLWKVSNLWRRIVLCAVMLPLLFSTVMARLNYFEWMFHPVPSVQFESEAQSKLDAGEMILALRFGNDARAYPIREMAYHHVVNDVVAGIPVAVTY
jgi:Protein of unknown function (DUF3179)